MSRRAPYRPPLSRVLTRGAIWAAVLGLTCAVIVVAWRHRRGKASRAVAMVSLPAPVLAALAASQVVWFPTRSNGASPQRLGPMNPSRRMTSRTREMYTVRGAVVQWTPTRSQAWQKIARMSSDRLLNE